MKAMLHTIFQRHWNPYVVLLIAGLLSALYFGLTSTVWAVTGEFTRLGGDILQLLGVDVADWQYYQMIKLQGATWSRPDGWIVWGMFIGALMMVLLSNSFKIRLPQQKRRYVQGFVGGIIAGFGARLAMGCNLAAFFYRSTAVFFSLVDFYCCHRHWHFFWRETDPNPVVERSTVFSARRSATFKS